MAFVNSALRKEIMDDVTMQFFISVDNLAPSPFEVGPINARRASCEVSVPRNAASFDQVDQLWLEKWHGPPSSIGVASTTESKSLLSSLFSVFSAKSVSAQSPMSSPTDTKKEEKTIWGGRSSAGDAFNDWPVTPDAEDRTWED